MATEVAPKKRRGRPPKKAVAAKKAGGRGKIGRPKGDAAIINDFKARLLASPKSRKVLDSILDAALDDDHKSQAAAWKLLMDRLVPVSHFDKEKMGSGKSQVNITITGVDGQTQVIGEPDKDIEGSCVTLGSYDEEQE